MEISKVINNNVVLTHDDQGKELVVMGRGLAFKKRPGDQVDTGLVEKTFVLEGEGVSAKLAELLADVSEKYLVLSEKIMTMAAMKLGVKLDDYLYVALTDHLSFAITRYKQGIKLQNALAWEIKKYYRKEYQTALEALTIIEEDTGIMMDENEAASIAMHLVNSQVSGEGLESITKVVTTVNDILTIVKYHFNVTLDEESMNYERFLTHLRFFAWRLMKKEQTVEEQTDDFFYQQVERQYPQAFECSGKIAVYIQKELNWTLSKDERIYLTLHIHRVTSRHAMQHSPRG
ncbi:BglG family transcription antiterminator LicT [Rossellomorea marisflavi]|uniref:BglG family transcription antiterminator LicT n=1 Tax=Rossellomorea marisflavi TaxID=189381 RepID=UPI003D2EB9D8